MAKHCLSLRFTVLFSLSLSFACVSPLSPSSSAPKATPSDLLALLGPTKRSSSLNPVVARDLASCFRFLVPRAPPARPADGTAFCSDVVPRRRSLARARTGNGGLSEREEDQLVWWPPPPVLDLARLSVDSGGDPAAIHRALDPTMIPVPDVEGSKEDRCELTRTPYGRHFISEELNSYFEFLFELIVARGPAVGLNISLTRYDLFHGHLFLAKDTGRLGILFHAKEYPAFDKEVFPYNMGYCQMGSDVTYDDSMNLRNILWLAPLPSNSTKQWEAPGVLVVLDARPDGIIYRDIIPEYVHFARTIYEDDLGEVAVDVNYFNVGSDDVPNYQLYIC